MEPCAIVKCGAFETKPTLVFAHGGTNVMTIHNTYDNLNRLTGRQSVVFSGVAGSARSFDYQYNAANPRTRVTPQDGSYCVISATSERRAARKDWDR
jgi:hypothetical protein